MPLRELCVLEALEVEVRLGMRSVTEGEIARDRWGVGWYNVETDAVHEGGPVWAEAWKAWDEFLAPGEFTEDEVEGMFRGRA